MKRHIGAVHLKIRFECDICGKTFPEKGKLQSHVKNSHGNTLHCSKCDKTFEYLKSYKTHMSVQHSDGDLKKAHECAQCNFSTHYPEGLKIHMKSIHNAIPSKCDLCDLICSSEIAL